MPAVALALGALVMTGTGMVAAAMVKITESEPLPAALAAVSTAV